MRSGFLSRLLVLSLLPLGAARATTIRGPADIATLTRSADAVLRAKVISKGSAWAAGGESSGQIFTTVALQPIEQWKGAPAGGQISIRIPGGEMGDLFQETVGTGTFQPGEEVVVFLRLRAPAAKGQLAVYEVSHWALGKFSLGVSRAAAKAMRDRTGVECVGCGPDEEDLLSLDALRAKVRAAQKVQP